MITTNDPSSMLKILDRQMHQWEIRRQLARQGGETARLGFAHLERGPWITISKSLASGWEQVARHVSDTLGWPVFDKEVLDEISRHAGVREMILSRLDERGVRRLEDAALGLVVPDYPGQSAFVLEMRRVMLALAHQGHTILVGRGANWILDPAYGLRVRIFAPRETRLARVRHAEGLSEEQARRRVEVDDDEKSEFVRQAFGREIDDPAGYDLMLNLGSLVPRAAAECVVAALRCKLGAS
jgi:cytidylate kinase-like protein